MSCSLSSRITRTKSSSGCSECWIIGILLSFVNRSGNIREKNVGRHQRVIRGRKSKKDRQYNCKNKRPKAQTMIYNKTQYNKLKVEQCESQYKPWEKWISWICLVVWHQSSFIRVSAVRVSTVCSDRCIIGIHSWQ